MGRKTWKTWDRPQFCVTPDQRQRGEDRAILKQRDAPYRQARAKRPERWSGDTRDWTPVGAVTLNPATEKTEFGTRQQNALEAA